METTGQLEGSLKDTTAALGPIPKKGKQKELPNPLLPGDDGDLEPLYRD